MLSKLCRLRPRRSRMALLHVLGWGPWTPKVPLEGYAEIPRCRCVGAWRRVKYIPSGSHLGSGQTAASGDAAASPPHQKPPATFEAMDEQQGGETLFVNWFVPQRKILAAKLSCGMRPTTPRPNLELSATGHYFIDFDVTQLPYWTPHRSDPVVRPNAFQKPS